jgi:chromosomal replication initiation ATPase DnaA
MQHKESEPFNSHLPFSTSTAYAMPGFRKVKKTLLTSEKVIEMAATTLGKTRQEIVCRSRVAELIEIRFVIAYICRKLTSDTFGEIGKTLKLHHSTVIYANNTVTNMLKLRDPRYIDLYMRLTKNLKQ